MTNREKSERSQEHIKEVLGLPNTANDIEVATAVDELAAELENKNNRLDEIASIASPDAEEQQRKFDTRVDRMEARQDRIETVLGAILEHLKIKQEAA